MMTKEKLTVPGFRTRKEEHRKISMVTAYDFTSAILADRSPVDVLLVGDSLGMVMLGYGGTTGVTMDEMVHHMRPVVRGAPNTFILGDLPFGSYHASSEEAVRNGVRLMKEGGVDAVKLEGGVQYFETVRALVRAGIPVVGHIGLTPQTASALGGMKAQGRDAESARRILEDALALEQAGAFALVLECIPAALAAEITHRLSIPTIGIGAGVGCDGQVLVWHDMLGLYDPGYGAKTFKFVKRYADLGPQVVAALAEYAAEVNQGVFPGPEHSFRIKEEELLRALGERELAHSATLQ